MKQKLIIFDIDGTIVDHYKKEIPTSTIKALKLLQANNHTIAIASGKGPVYIENMFDNITIDTYAALNGNYVVLHDKLIYQNTIDAEVLKRFEHFCLKEDIPFTMADKEGTTTLFKNKEIITKY